jgi:Ca-activated chloride channel homolog
VTFGTPLALFALLVLPVLALVYMRQQGRRRAAAAAFVRPALQPSVAPERPRWRRHLPMLAILLACAILIVAAAQPERTVAVPVERASIMLLTDVSGSMEATDVKPSRLAAAKRAAHTFVDDVPTPVNVGVLAFNQTPRVLQSPTRDRDAVHTAIERMTSSGGTATGQAIATATQALERVPGELGKRPPSAIVLLSDGASTSGVDPIAAAREAKRLKIPVYTVALGTPAGTIEVPRRGGGTETRPVPPDPESLAEIARTSGGKAFTASSTDGLKQVYEKLGSQLGHKDEKRQITSAFAGGGLALLLVGGVMSLGWFGRPI